MTENTIKLNPPRVSIIVPTFRESENLPELLERIRCVAAQHSLALEVLIMDDDSRDGTEEIIARLAFPWVQLCVRTQDRGLSPAVLDGFRHALGKYLLVMDADLSHPPEKIPEMLAALDAGADFVIGSRYASGGSTGEDWGILRWINSRAATLLALPFTRVKDPMSGFFALSRDTFMRADPLNPVGYKIGLEMLVKCRCARIVEIPIHFSQRKHGESKLSLQEQLRYLQHLRRLFIYKYGNWAHFAQFAAVGFSGTLVNLIALTVLIAAGIPLWLAVALAIFIAMLSNFALNRRFTFSYAREGSFWTQLVGFIAASSFGAIINYATTIAILKTWPALVSIPQIASVVGIMAGLIFNYLASRYFVFTKP